MHPYLQPVIGFLVGFAVGYVIIVLHVCVNGVCKQLRIRRMRKRALASFNWDSFRVDAVDWEDGEHATPAAPLHGFGRAAT